MNSMQHEQLFTDLTPTQAAVVTGGDALGCPYTTTEDVKTCLRIRSAPSLKAKVVGFWRPGEINFLQSPAITKNGFRKFSDSSSRWVFAEFIKRVPGKCIPL